MKFFDEIKPVFFIDNKMNDILNDINVKLKKINVNDKQKRKYMISKSKIRSIHSSLAIEANSLSLFDVESISENKLILGKKDEVQEVKNAIEAYNHINEYNYKSENDLLKLHELMMKYFDEDNGNFLPTIESMDSLAGTNAGQVAISLIGEYQTVIPQSLTSRSHCRCPSMGSFLPINV